MPLLCQSDPSKDQIGNWLKNFPDIADFVMNLQGQQAGRARCISARNEQGKIPQQKLVTLQKWVFEEMMEKRKKRDLGTFSRLVGTDGLHPEQAIAFEEWINFMETSEYRCVRFIEQPKTDGRHFTLNTFPYTHFTSPLRRYADILVHRLVHAYLDKQLVPYAPSEVNEICRDLNTIKRRAQNFRQESRHLSWGQKLKSKPTLVHGFVSNVSEEEIKVCIPSLKNLQQNCRTIPVCLLKLCRQPELKTDTESSRPFLTFHWERKLYVPQKCSAEKTTATNNEKGAGFRRINPHQNAVFLPKYIWGNIFRAVLNNNENDILNKNFDKKHLEASRTQFDTVDDIFTEEHDLKCRYSMSVSIAQVLRIQLTAQPNRGIYAPAIQVLQMAPNVKFCLEHMRNAIGVFTKMSSVQTKQKYLNPEHYVKTWLPLVDMEATSNAVRNDTTTINDIPMEFYGENVAFALTNSFCEQRDIHIQTMHLESILLGRNKVDNGEDMSALKYVTSSDYLCIQCQVSENDKPIKTSCSRTAGTSTKSSLTSSPSNGSIWVAHARTTAIVRDRDTGVISLRYQLTKDSPRPFPSMVTTGDRVLKVNCDIELIAKNEHDR